MSFVLYYVVHSGRQPNALTDAYRSTIYRYYGIFSSFFNIAHVGAVTRTGLPMVRPTVDL